MSGTVTLTELVLVRLHGDFDQLLLTAADVIHAGGVPAVGMKKDAIPGFVTELWFRAVYAGGGSAGGGPAGSA